MIINKIIINISKVKSYKIYYFIYFLITTTMNLYNLVLYIYETYSKKREDGKKIIIEKNIKIQELMCGTYFTNWIYNNNKKIIWNIESYQILYH